MSYFHTVEKIIPENVSVILSGTFRSNKTSWVVFPSTIDDDKIDPNTFITVVYKIQGVGWDSVNGEPKAK